MASIIEYKCDSCGKRFPEKSQYEEHEDSLREKTVPYAYDVGEVALFDGSDSLPAKITRRRRSEFTHKNIYEFEAVDRGLEHGFVPGAQMPPLGEDRIQKLPMEYSVELVTKVRKLFDVNEVILEYHPTGFLSQFGDRLKAIVGLGNPTLEQQEGMYLISVPVRTCDDENYGSYQICLNKHGNLLKLEYIGRHPDGDWKHVRPHLTYSRDRRREDYWSINFPGISG